MPFLSFPTKNKKIIKSYNIKSDINGRTRTKIAEIKILVSIKIIPKELKQLLEKTDLTPNKTNSKSQIISPVVDSSRTPAYVNFPV